MPLTVAGFISFPTLSLYDIIKELPRGEKKIGLILKIAKSAMLRDRPRNKWNSLKKNT